MVCMQQVLVSGFLALRVHFQDPIGTVCTTGQRFSPLLPLCENPFKRPAYDQYVTEMKWQHFLSPLLSMTCTITAAVVRSTWLAYTYPLILRCTFHIFSHLFLLITVITVMLSMLSTFTSISIILCMLFCYNIDQSWQKERKWRAYIWCCTWFASWCSRSSTSSTYYLFVKVQNMMSPLPNSWIWSEMLLQPAIPSLERNQMR